MKLHHRIICSVTQRVVDTTDRAVRSKVFQRIGAVVDTPQRLQRLRRWGERVERSYYYAPEWVICFVSFALMGTIGRVGEIIRDPESGFETPPEESLWSAFLWNIPGPEDVIRRVPKGVPPEKAFASIRGVLKSVPKDQWAIVIVNLNTKSRKQLRYWLDRFEMLV